MDIVHTGSVLHEGERSIQNYRYYQDRDAILGEYRMVDTNSIWKWFYFAN